MTPRSTEAHIDHAALAVVTPRALDVYRQTFASADTVLPSFGIASVFRLRHFLAQCCHETGGLTVEVENLNYSAERLMKVWPSRFKTIEAAQALAHRPEALANVVYGGRMGNHRPGDGWAFRGRGLLQITGRAKYERVGALLGIDLAENPNFAFAPGHALVIAAAVWRDAGCNAFADLDDLTRVTRAINGGTVGIASRRTWLADVGPVVVEDDEEPAA